MGLKAGWIALFVFVWVIGAFLGSTFDYQSTSASEGMAYSEGTNDSTAVTGIGTTWIAAMEGGVIRADDDGIWTKILSINSNTTLTLYNPYSGDGGVGLDYTMKASPGWAGEGGAGYTVPPITKLENLVQINQSQQRNPLLGAITILTSSSFWEAAFQIVTWQWSFLYNADGTMAFGLFYWIFLFPFVVMGMLSMLLLVYGIVTGNIQWG